MKSIQLLSIPLVVAICVSTTFGQETKKQDDKKDLAKAGTYLHGVWNGDADKTAEEIKKMKDLDLSEDMIKGMLEQVGSIEVEFEDGKFSVAFGDQEMAGEWEVTKMKKKEKTWIIEIKTVTDEDSGGEEKNFEIHFLGKTHMKMVDLDDQGPPIVMKKAKAKKDN